MTHLLTDGEYLALFDTLMEPRGEDDEPPFDFWPYFDAIPADDFCGRDCSLGSVTHAFRHPGGRYEHVLVDSRDPEAFMVLVLDVVEKRVVGHRLLELSTNADDSLEGHPPRSAPVLRLCASE
jgi:hypothetical protein